MLKYALVMLAMTISPTDAQTQKQPPKQPPKWQVAPDLEPELTPMAIDLNSIQREGSGVNAMVCMDYEDGKCLPRTTSKFFFDCAGHFTQIRTDGLKAKPITATPDSQGGKIAEIACAR